MTYQKRSNSANNRYQIPVMPRVPRSAKRKRSARCKIENNQMCAFDLLTALAGEILAEQEGFLSPLKGAIFDQGSCEISHNNKENIKSLEGSTTNALVKSDESENDPIGLNRKTPVTISSDGRIDVLSYENCCKVRGSSFPSISEDNGENSYNLKADCSEDHRRKKMPKLTCRNTDPLAYNDDMEIKPLFRSHRLFYTRQKNQRGLLKRRKLSNRRSVSPVKDVNRLEAASDLLAALNGSNNMPCETTSKNFMCEPEDHPVKLSIKSFEVPELLIEMPEYATVGSLKRTVMEAVMAILRDGLHVGVLLQGQKVRDDNKTLRQAGFSYEDKLSSLNFTLEPNTRTTLPPRHNLKEPALMISDPHPLNMIDDKEASETTNLPPPIPIPAKNSVDSDHENSLHSPVVLPPFPYKPASDSKALVPILASNPDTTTQCRRIRRPFSIPEVEALVEAVEKIGTGRWRDVKLRAFRNCKHRTYVDLKDKWKTLVHTASISPRQRRGESVPQDLLDRVLSAHSNWSHKKANLPGMAHLCLLV